MVTNILGMFAGGYSLDQILNAYPQLSSGDVSAALAYARDVIKIRFRPGRIQS